MKVYAGADPLTGREIRLRKTCKTERAARIELGKLLEQAAAGRRSRQYRRPARAFRRGSTTLKHHADPVSEVDRRAASYLAQLTTRSAAQSG